MLNKPYVILIGGGSASGKSSIANLIIDEIKNLTSISLIQMDNYYKTQGNLTYEERTKINYDHPDSIDFELLTKDLTQLLNQKQIESKIYDFEIHQHRNDKIKIKPANIIIVDGILSLHEKKLREKANLKIFIKTPSDIRFIRRLTRDIVERGRAIEGVVEQYLATVRPMHNYFIGPTIKYADIVINYTDKDKLSVDFELIIAKIKSNINKKVGDLNG